MLKTNTFFCLICLKHYRCDKENSTASRKCLMLYSLNDLSRLEKEVCSHGFSCQRKGG